MKNKFNHHFDVDKELSKAIDDLVNENKRLREAIVTAQRYLLNSIGEAINPILEKALEENHD